MEFSLNHLQKLPPPKRLAYVREWLAYHEANAGQILPLSDRQKDRIGRLLCHASPEDLRKLWPIIGDLPRNKADEKIRKAQAKFDQLAPFDGPDAAREKVLGEPDGETFYAVPEVQVSA